MIVSLVPTPTEAFGIDTNSKQKAHCDIKKYQQKKFLKNLFLMQNFLTFKIKKKKIIIIILMIQENVLSINFEKKKDAPLIIHRMYVIQFPNIFPYYLNPVHLNFLIETSNCFKLLFAYSFKFNCYEILEKGKLREWTSLSIFHDCCSCERRCWDFRRTE